MDIHWVTEIFAKYFSAGYGVPTTHQWPVFVLSKVALVLLPLISVRWFNSYMDAVRFDQRFGSIPFTLSFRRFCEKFIAHAMFYIGMGIPIIGFTAVADIHRLLGFTLVNMFIHEVLPVLLSEGRFKRVFPEWRKTLGVNLIIDAVKLEISVYRDRNGQIRVEESPHSAFKSFIRETVRGTDAKGPYVLVKLRRFFVPKNTKPHFLIRPNPGFAGLLTEETLGSYFKIDFVDLSDYAAPVYINQQGRQNWLWRPQYWTKFFNEVGGKSYMASPFQIIRKFFLVVCGTPLAFCAGNVLVHYHYGGTLNFHPLLHFNYGIIFAFTIGGMYGASTFSTLIELLAWKAHLAKRKYSKLLDTLRQPASWVRPTGSRSFSPYLNPELFGAMLERENKAYRHFRLIAGGLLMGGICSWGVTYFFGMTFERYIDRQIRPAVVATVAPKKAIHTGVYVDEKFVAIAKTFSDRDRKLFQTNSTLAGSW